MKYCSHCGAEIFDNAVVCIKCGCSVSDKTTQFISVINPNDAPSGGFAILSFFFPLIGLILWLAWNNSSPKKSKSCGKGALIGIIVEIILIPLFIFITTSTILTHRVLNERGESQAILDPTSEYIGTRPQYSTISLIGQLNTRTRDQTHTVVVEMLIEYDLNNNAAQTELTGRVNQLRDFTKNFFATKYYSDLTPENEERLKQEIREILNTRYLDTAKVRGIIFNKLDVMEL